MRDAADLLNCVVNERADVGCRLLHRLRGPGLRDDSVSHHFCRAELLAQPVVQFARDPATLFILRRDQIAGKAAQFAIQHFQLLRLAMQFGENADLRAQQFRIHGNGNVIHGPAFIALEPVEVGQVHCRR